MTLEIRQITAVDHFLLEAMARLMPQLSPRLSTPSAEQLQRVVENPLAALFAAWDGSQVVGVLTMVWYDVPSGRKAWIEDVVVDAAARGCGAGGALVQAALRHATQIGTERVLLTSSSSRTAARELYRKLGFQEMATTVFALKMK